MTNLTDATTSPARPSPTSSQLAEIQVQSEALHARRRSLLSTLRRLMQETASQRERLRGEWQVRVDGHSRSTADRLRGEYGLTPREIEVAELLADGVSNATVAARLGISPHTARHHTQRVLGKLGVHSRAEATARLRG